MIGEIVVPPAFELGATPSLVQRNTSLTVKVTPAPTPQDEWLLYLDGPCVDATSSYLASVAGDSLTFDLHGVTRPSGAMTTCSVTLKVQHVNVGKADARFNQPWANDIVGIQERRSFAQFAY